MTKDRDEMAEETGRATELNMVHIVRSAQANTPQLRTGPGLLLLHGRGANEYDLMGLEEGLDPRLTIVSARAPYTLGGGFQWYDMYRIGETDAKTIQSSLIELRKFIEGMIDLYRIDPKRLYLMGFSQGAIMSAALTLAAPEKIRGVIMHSGYVPTDTGPAANPVGLQGKPFFMAHGKYDDIIPVTYGRDAAEYLAEHNTRLTYQEYQVGHTISEESFYDLSEWLSNELDNISDE